MSFYRLLLMPFHCNTDFREGCLEKDSCWVHNFIKVIGIEQINRRGVIIHLRLIKY